MSDLEVVESMIDAALVYVKDAQALLSLTDPFEAAIGGSLSTIEVGLTGVSEVVEHIIEKRQG